MRKLVYVLFISLLLFTCNSNEKKMADNQEVNVHEAVVLEVIHVRDYSYLRAKNKGKEQWLAVPKTEIKTGDTYYYDSFMEMKGFESKELNKTFESIYFLEAIRNTPEKNVAKEQLSGTMHQSTKKEPTKVAIDIESEGNAITIAELYKNKTGYNNKTVRLKGKVVKYNPAIMGSNWIHLQDGTEFEGAFDITVTTQDEVNINDIVVLEGNVTLNKDFGAGYKYDVIVENATLIK